MIEILDWFSLDKNTSLIKTRKGNYKLHNPKNPVCKMGSKKVIINEDDYDYVYFHEGCVKRAESASAVLTLIEDYEKYMDKWAE